MRVVVDSIPEAPNSGRNWDYRFSWLRDSYFVVNALNALGVTKTMEEYLSYILNIAAASEYGYLQPVFGITQSKQLDESVVDSLPGYRGMGPVRIGNSAYMQVQNDGYGSVILACAQRLMRKICSMCKEPVTYPPRMFEDLGIDPKFFKDATLYRGRGCERCKNTGYSGRTAIIEVMTITDEIRKMVIERKSAMEIGKMAMTQGMKTLRQVALDKVREGVSTLEQVLLLTSSH